MTLTREQISEWLAGLDGVTQQAWEANGSRVEIADEPGHHIIAQAFGDEAHRIAWHLSRCDPE